MYSINLPSELRPKLQFHFRKSRSHSSHQNRLPIGAVHFQVRPLYPEHPLRHSPQAKSPFKRFSSRQVYSPTLQNFRPGNSIARLRQLQWAGLCGWNAAKCLASCLLSSKLELSLNDSKEFWSQKQVLPCSLSAPSTVLPKLEFSWNKLSEDQSETTKWTAHLRIIFLKVGSVFDLLPLYPHWK